MQTPNTPDTLPAPLSHVAAALAAAGAHVADVETAPTAVHWISRRGRYATASLHEGEIVIDEDGCGRIHMGDRSDWPAVAAEILDEVGVRS